MGPRSIDRGISSTGRRSARADMLQWGRDLSIAEFTDEELAAIGCKMLQWGRDLSIAEFIRQGIGEVYSRRLQWGRDLSIAELTGSRGK